MFETYFLVLMLTAVVLVGRRILIGPLIGTALLIAQQNLLSLGGDWNKIILGSVLAHCPDILADGACRPVPTLWQNQFLE